MLDNMDRQEISRTILQIQVSTEIDLGGSQGFMTQVELDLVDLSSIF
jgi:hypothetical protein